MIRKIECRSCAAGKYPIDSVDRQNGWKFRRTFISCQLPKIHGITLNGIFHSMQDVHCDNCMAVITGTIVVATTMWQSTHEPQPRFWETDYGAILPDEAVQVSDALTGNNLKETGQR